MESVKVGDFSSGWIPSDSDQNGRKNGLLKMTGCTLDENGSLSLANGTKKGSFTYPAVAHTLFSKYLCGQLNNYAALVNGAVYRNSTQIIAPAEGSTTRAAFGTSGDAVIIFSGAKRIKDTCSGIISTFGTAAPTAAPLVNVLPALTRQEGVNIVGDLNNWIHNNGQATDFYGAASIFTKVPPDQFTSDAGYNGGNGEKAMHAIDYNISSLDFPKDMSGDAVDTFEINFDSTTANNIFALGVYFLLDPGMTGTGGRNNWFSTLWDANKIKANLVNNRIKYKAARSDFQRVGSNLSLNWSAVYGIQIDVVFKYHQVSQGSPVGPADQVTVSGFKYSGSVSVADTSVPLKGSYEYAQVNVINGRALSQLSPISEQVIVDHNEVEVIPQDPTLIDINADEVWLYRRGGTLDSFYRVARIPYGLLGPFYDSRSDEDVLAEGEIFEDFLIVDSTQLTDTILEIVGPINNRFIYFSATRMHFSLPDTLDHYSPDQSMNISGTVGEVFLWAKKVAENVVIVATNRDLYTLSGSMETFPDGSLNVYFRPMGIDKPPICRDASVYKGSIVYYVHGGWVIISLGNDYGNLTEPSTDLLYKGKLRYEYGGVPTQTLSEFRYTVAVSGNKMFCVVPIITDYADPENSALWSKRMECYDLGRKYWVPYNYFPDLITVGEDGKLYGFFNTLLRLDRIDYPFSKLINTP